MTPAATPRPVATTLRGGRRRPARLLTGSVLPRVVLIIGSIAFIAPFYWMFISALKTPQEATQTPPSFVPQSWVWQNFIDAVNFIPFGVFTLNSVILTLGITIGSILSNTLIAYGF